MNALLLSLTLGCLPTMSASIIATITDNNQEVVPNPSIEIRAWDGSLLTELTGEEDGSFETNIPPFQEFFVIISSDAHPPTSFTGYSGEGPYAVPNGTLWVRTFDEVTAVKEQFSTCTENESTTTGFIEGQAKLYISGSLVEDLPSLTTATATATQNEDESYEGCYLPMVNDNEENTNEEEIVESTMTGDSGQYAVFNVPEGLTELTIELDVDGELYDYPYWVYVPANGIVPLHPTLVPFLELP